MKQIKVDPLPVISQKWGQESEDEKTFYINPTSTFLRKNPLFIGVCESVQSLYF